MAWVKDLLSIGTYHPPGSEPATFSRADLESMRRNGNRMLARRWTVPVCVEHQDEAKPTRRLSRAEAKARGFLCFTEGFRITPEGVLQAYGEDPVDPADAKLLQKLQFVSPEIEWGWKTGDGRVWDGPSITHLALTPTPVNNRQRPFQRLSMGGGGPIRLSMADYKGSKMAGEKDDELDPKLAKDDEAEDAAVETDEAGDAPGKAEEAAEESGAEGDAELASLFETIGLHVPVETMGDIKEFKSALCIAIKTKAMNSDESAGEPGTDDLESEIPTDDGTAPPGAQPAPSPPPVGGGLGLSLSKREEKLVEHTIREGKAKKCDRLERCYKTGRITPDVYRKRLPQFQGVRLSMNADGEIDRTELDAMLEAWEDLPPNAASGVVRTGPNKGKTRLSAAEPAPMPADRQGPPASPEEARRVNDEMDAAKRANANV